MRKLYDGAIAILVVFSGVLCLLMLGIVLVGVFYRYVVGEALSWYDEFAGFVLVWLTMVGSVVALAKRKHISFETLVEKLPRRGQDVVEVVVDLSVLAFSLVLVVYGGELIREMGDETAVSLPHFRMAWVYSVLPISGALMAIIGVAQLILRFRSATRAPPSQGMQEAQ